MAWPQWGVAGFMALSAFAIAANTRDLPGERGFSILLLTGVAWLLYMGGFWS